MHISIQSPSGNRTEYFGVRDFETENGYESETITLHFPNQEEKTIPGRVISGINESSYTRRMLYEELDNLTDEENIKIVIVKSGNNHKVVQSAMLYIDKKTQNMQTKSQWLENTSNN